ncbi:MCE family protein [Mycolicibacterium brumae]|uniref:Mammalian cell entry protein n=1 Tax=Mycolicibacterium brumae TaxID=85968 RepID=A0A2G5PHB1_9MYCO|nr:MCE family protein [Mycolicibacterium brumae]MCV7194504.1 MCE family protein [Mycolicibacterium brumae]PIB77692.1 mammalian cell entry protein [Mycolicibacterium brumae]RWA20111.1 hypothetical protein MBRU_15875 [Mycolicibacterium brumae DSM 44177]UWW10039.1 MCE family protein [Mycolicibacterium brumae]
MQVKRPLEDLSQAWLGAIALATLGALILATTALSALHLGKTSYTAEFPQAASIRPGDQVSVAGVPIGAVSATDLAGDRVLVTMKLDPKVRLGDGTQASIKLTTVLGSRYIELRPRGDNPLPDNRIGLHNTSVPYDLQKVLEDSTTTFEAVDAQRFAESLDTVSVQLAGVPSVLPDALNNISALSEVISTRRSQIADLLRNTARVSNILGDQREDLSALITQGRALTAELVNRRASVERLLNAATTLVSVAGEVMNTDRAHIDKMLADLKVVTAMMGDHEDLLHNLFQIMPVAMRNAANATGSGPFLDFMLPGGLMVDSWMCAIASRAEQYHWPERYQYFKDCQ